MINVIDEPCKSLSQVIYDNILERLDLSHVACSCGAIGDFIKYGTYHRTVKELGATFSMKVQRVKCKSCGYTHAVLPGQLVPYQQHSAKVQQIILQLRLGSPELNTIMEDNIGITEADVLTLRHRFKKHWAQRLKTMGMDLCCAISDLIQSSFSWFNRQFLQIRRGIVCKYCIPTPIK